jgi:hypothetical protein
VEDLLDLPPPRADNKLRGASLFSIPFLMWVVDNFATSRVCTPRTQRVMHFDDPGGHSIHSSVYVRGTTDISKIPSWRFFEKVVSVEPPSAKFGLVVVITEQEDLRHGIQDCLNKPGLELLVFYLTAETDALGHGNGVIVNVVEKTVLRVEPNGAWDPQRRNESLETQQFDDIMTLLEKGMQYICAELFPGYKCLSFSDVEVCPTYLGLHQIQQQSSRTGMGYCAAWSQFLLTTQILNPDYSFEDLTDAIVRANSPASLKRLIRRFVDYVDLVIQTHRPDVWQRYLQEIAVYYPQEYNRYLSIESPSSS